MTNIWKQLYFNFQVYNTDHVKVICDTITLHKLVEYIESTYEIMHEIIINSIPTFKLFLFQSFPIKYIKNSVGLIKSFHVALDFKDLVDARDLNRFRFLVELVTELALVYRIEKCFWMCKDVVESRYFKEVKDEMKDTVEKMVGVFPELKGSL